MTPSVGSRQRAGVISGALLFALLLPSAGLAAPWGVVHPSGTQEQQEQSQQEEQQGQEQEQQGETGSGGNEPVRPPEMPPEEPIFDPVAAQLRPGTPDELVTMGGSRLIGEVKELARAQVKFKTTATDNIFVKWELVRTIRTSRFFEVELTSGLKFYGLIVGTEEGRLFVGAGERFTEVQRDEVVAINRIRADFWDRIKGSLDIGVGISKASSQRDLTGNLSARYRTRKAFWNLTGSSYLRKQEGADNVNRNSIALAYNRFFAPNWFLTVLASAEHNSELGIELRGLGAVGAGYHLLRNLRNDLMVWSGIAPSRELFTGEEQPDQSNLEAVVGAIYSFYFLGATDTKIEIQALFYPSLTTGGRYRLTADGAIRHEFTTDFSVSLNGFYSADSKPPNELAAKTDYSVSLGLGVTW